MTFGWGLVPFGGYGYGYGGGLGYGYGGGGGGGLGSLLLYGIAAVVIWQVVSGFLNNGDSSDYGKPTARLDMIMPVLASSVDPSFSTCVCIMCFATLSDAIVAPTCAVCIDLMRDCVCNVQWVSA